MHGYAFIVRESTIRLSPSLGAFQIASLLPPWSSYNPRESRGRSTWLIDALTFSEGGPCWTRDLLISVWDSPKRQHSEGESYDHLEASIVAVKRRGKCPEGATRRMTKCFHVNPRFPLPPRDHARQGFLCAVSQ